MAEQDESLDRGAGPHRTSCARGQRHHAGDDSCLSDPEAGRWRRTGGFYRRWYPGGRSSDFGEQGRLEAYSWGGLTSGPAARAAWLLVLPLMLVNLAHWMLPATPVDPSRRQLLAGHVSAVLLRLLGLILTLTMLLTAVLVAVDLTGWQCGRSSGVRPRYRLSAGSSMCSSQARAAGWPSPP